MNDDAILTVNQVADLLKVSKKSVYEWTTEKGRARMLSNPFPVLRINGSVRFVRLDVLAWIGRQST
jgi:predicted DNA-binding transcriptional regulator AlpA